MLDSALSKLIATYWDYYNSMITSKQPEPLLDCLHICHTFNKEQFIETKRSVTRIIHSTSEFDQVLEPGVLCNGATFACALYCINVFRSTTCKTQRMGGKECTNTSMCRESCQEIELEAR